MSPQRHKPQWLALLVTVLALVLVLRPEPARQFQSIGALVFEPVELGISGLLEQFDQVWVTLQKVGQLARSNDQLRDDVDRLQSELVRMRELEAENRNLRDLLRLTQPAGPSEIIPTTKMASDPSPFIQSITVDRGANDGVREGMVVVTNAGLVGRVLRSEALTSKVLLITDTSSSLTGRLQIVDRELGSADAGASSDLRATGTVRGFRVEREQVVRHILVMQYIPHDVPVGMSDYVITSNLGGAFPEGLVVGRIIQTRRKDSDPLQEAYIEPAVDMNRLERMYILGAPAPLS